MLDHLDADLVQKVASELAVIRQRGVDNIDLQSSKQSPLDLPELERLARDYAVRVGAPLSVRSAQVIGLLKDSLHEFSGAGYPSDARFVEALFFDPEDNDRQTRPGERLDALKKKTGLSESAFEDKRRAVFTRFAEYLAVFVRSGSASQPPPRRWTHLAPVAAGLAVLALIGVGAVVAWNVGLFAGDADSPAQRMPDGPDVLLHSPGVSPSIGPPPEGVETITEQQGSFGAPTFSDPFDPAATGWTVPPFAYVEITCKVYAPTLPSVTPDGYWYRIASSPWDNEWYAVANTFWNGDTPGQPAENHTDFDIPDCEP